ncbi:MAG: ribbon-helix-helix protein, CopG family [Microbacterium sp.]|uniref:ribbon-helix-helix protein, CopG family n=1 Tax=Microbacterium sp. TaxID=51671 RepID=UPI003A8583FD
MRTTLSIDDELLARAKSEARAKGQTLGEFVEDVLRHGLATPQRPRGETTLTVSRATGGARAGVDLTTNRGLYDAVGIDAA